jgi:hypothetical protein
MNSLPEAIAQVVKAYVELWADHEPARRAGLIAASLEVDAEILGPGYRFKGHAAIDEEVERFRREQPGFRAIVNSGFEHHHHVVRFAVAMARPDGSILVEGEDILVLSARGLIQQVFTFWGALPRITS